MRTPTRSGHPLRGQFAFLGIVATTLACATAAPAPEPPPVQPPPKPAEPPPPPPDPATVTEGDVTVGWVNGMQVIVKNLPHAELVAGRLFIKGGVRNWGKDDAGVEQLAVSVASSGGTQKLDKDAFARSLAALGSTLGASAGNDFSAWAAKSLAANWDPTFDLFVDAFMNPALPEGEIQIQRERQISTLRHELEDPDAHLGLIIHESLFKGHPYANRSIGTLDSVARLTRQNLVDHLAMLRETSRLVFVVVGAVDPAHVLTQVKTAFGGLPRGQYKNAPLPPLHFDKSNLVAVDQKLPTDYIEAEYPGPGWGDPDFPAAYVAAHQLHYRVFEEVRTKRNLSYAPAANYSGGSEYPRGSLYVTAVDPNQTMAVMYDEARRLKKDLVTDKDLAGDKSVFLTGLLMASEATDGQAELLARAQLYGGDWRLAKTLPERVRAVTAADVRAFADKYINHLQVFVLGDAAKLDRALFESL